MSKRLIVTSALPYANGPIHFGHIVGAYLPADIYVRFRRMLGDQVHYVCGTDEHGVAITLKAEQAGQDYASYVDHWHGVIREALERVGVEFDIFTGTANHRNPHHRELSQQFFSDLLANGWLVEKVEEQYFSPSADRFLPDRYIQGECYECGYAEARGDECPNCGKYLDAKKLRNPISTLDGSVPELRESRHWYLDLARAREDWLGKWVESHADDWKPNVRNFVRSELGGLRERPITRDLPWGVPVPVEGAEGKVLYVWFDAPIGYLSISKQWFTERGDPEGFETLWQDPETELYHFIGKDNITFHAIVFPAILRGADRGWILPQNVPANEFFNLEGKKFNTSAGWYIPEEAVRDFPTDVLRYALCTMMPETADSEWTWEEFQSRVNNELADNLGNFVTRTYRFLEKFFDGAIPAGNTPQPQDEELLALARATAEEYRGELLRFGFRRAAQAAMNLSGACNRYYDSEQPWVSIKTDLERCGQVMRTCVEMIRSLATLFAPILPATAQALAGSMGLSAGPGSLDQVGRSVLPEGTITDTPLTASFPKFVDAKGREKTALFRKIEDDYVQQQVASLQASTMESEGQPQTEHEALAPATDYDGFVAVDLRAATVTGAEKHPKADRLLVLAVDMGFEQRTVVAGVAAAYSPEELVGKRVIVVANLEPRKLRGIESQGMLLAADDAAGLPRFIAPSSDTPDGTRVR